VTEHPIAHWYRYMESHDVAGLDDMLADDAVFESPVVFTPQRGKPIVKAYLSAAAQVLGGSGFTYVGEWRGENSAILEFEQEMDGIKINGIDMIWWNDEEKISRFKVMVRPLQAVNMLHRKMGEMLEGMKKGG
jgi:ketosteroid isomerase-like protein